MPKTAGTALREALAERAGEMLLDYGRAPETTRLVRVHAEARDHNGLCAKLAARERFVLFGHLKAADYRALRSVADFVTFLRDPFDRVVSEYNHFVKHYRYARPFRQFIDTAQFRNRQTLFTGGVPIEEYSFVGFHESYAEDLARLSERLGIAMQAPRVNVGDYANLDKATLWKRHGAYFRSINREDYALVERARARRHEKLRH